MAIFITADTHFGHKNILQYTQRPFSNVEEMDDQLITNWNETVGKTDIVYHLGDFAFMSVIGMEALLKRLNGDIRFILGNHDGKLSSVRNANIINKQIYEMRHGEHFVVMSHFPMLSWNRSFHGACMLHGHCHGTARYPYEAMRITDVGVDCQDYRPVELGTVLAELARRPSPKDHVANRELDGPGR